MSEYEIISGLMGVIESQRQTIDALLRHVERLEYPPIKYEAGGVTWTEVKK